MTIEIILNGDPCQIEEGPNLECLVDSLQLPNLAIAVAVNRKIMARRTWMHCVLQPADQVEVVRAIGGG